MIYINTNWNIPFYNMALEEYIITQFPEDEDYVFFYVHNPSIIIGKHQNAIEEINRDYVEKNNIYVARRLSGGGAVYHDQGNLNYSIITKKQDISVYDFTTLAIPILNALKELGISAECSGRNDLSIEGKKFSGGAQYRYKNRLLHHGTLLFDSELGNLEKALNIKPIKIESKGVKSVRSRVTNIKVHLKQEMTIEEFKQHVLKHLVKNQRCEEYLLSEENLEGINQKVNNKFSTWEWNWGESPKYNLHKVRKFACGIIDLRLNVEKGMIHNLHIFGDYFALQQIEHFSRQLDGVRYDKESLDAVLNRLDVGDYINGLTNQEFLALLID